MSKPGSTTRIVPHWPMDIRNPFARCSAWPFSWIILVVGMLAVIGCGEFVRYSPASSAKFERSENDQAKGGDTATQRAQSKAAQKTTRKPAKKPEPEKVESRTASAAKAVEKKADPEPADDARVKTRTDKLVEPEKDEPGKTAAAEKPDIPATASKNTTATADWCAALADRLFSVSPKHCENQGFADTGFRSVQGRVIAARDVSPQGRPSLGRVLLVGGTHGDELTSVSLTFWWSEMLDTDDNRIDWRIVPAMNPDGVMANPARRVNANDVDLNRNLPTPGWLDASQEYWREVGREPRRYPGEKAASEPETRWLVDAVQNYKPDVIVSLHAPYGVLDYDGSYPPPLNLGKLVLHRLGVFPGSLGNYGSRHLGIPVMTVELDHATRMPSRESAEQMWQDLNKWLVEYLSSLRQVESPTPQSSG